MKLRRFCENTWTVHELEEGEPCSEEFDVLVGGGGFGGPSRLQRVVKYTCGKTDHAPLDDQTLCGVGTAVGETCVKKLGHVGDHASDEDIAFVMIEDK